MITARRYVAVMLKIGLGLAMAASVDSPSRASPPDAKDKAANGTGQSSEATALRRWVGSSLLGEETPISSHGFTGGCPISFTYGGKPSGQLLGGWKRSVSHLPPADGRERHTVTWLDAGSGLEVACEVTVFADFPAAEWLLRLKNTGSKATPILEGIRPLDVNVGVGDQEAVVFHHAKGSDAGADDYATIAAALAPGACITLPAQEQRSQSFLPYFNLQWPGGGIVGAIGWTGQWELSVRRVAGRGVVLRAGQQRTHLALLPGESIRTPRILLVHWQGTDRMRGHNLLRRLLLAHYVPRINGRVVTPLLTQNTFFLFGDGNQTTQRNQLETIARIPALGLEGYWMDAGWFEGGWPHGTGNWFPKKDHFPQGLRVLGDAAHRAGLKFVLWFEPERVDNGSRIAREHPRWVLAHQMFNLGDPEARKWMTDFLSRRIADWGIDVYRQDRNFYPLPIWRESDPPDRQGITEIRHVEGLYAMWDELLRRHPGLMIDNANWRATGPDLEMVMRSAGSWTCSEAAGAGTNPVYNQSQLAGLSLYLPLHASLLFATDPYTVRSVARCGASLSRNVLGNFAVAEIRRAATEVRALRPLYLGDYYPLMEIDRDERHWCGWQFDRPDLGQGFALCFRRSASPEAARDVSLQGLDADARYEATFAETYDVKEKRLLTGRELSRLRVEIGKAPGSMLVRYSKSR
jgi:alpha-galactosidase